MEDKELFKQFRDPCPWRHNFVCDAKKSGQLGQYCDADNCAPFYWAKIMIVMMVAFNEVKEESK